MVHHIPLAGNFAEQEYILQRTVDEAVEKCGRPREPLGFAGMGPASARSGPSDSPDRERPGERGRPKPQI
jgi:hypothetical protein